MSQSKIEWTEATWNPITGCDKVSPGCKHCYAEKMAKRLKAMGQRNYRNGFKLTLHDHMLDYPLRWKKPMVIFVNSMSDIFHKDVPVEFILRIFDVMKKASWHTFQVLTKRSDRLLELDPHLTWYSNIWMGVSVENQDYAYRIDQLRNTHANIKFLSLEPLLGPLHNLDLVNINWVIVGGESGPKSRPIKEEWVRDIRDHCVDSKVDFFFKQWGGINKRKTGRTLDGQIWDQTPLIDFSRSWRS